MAYWKLPLVSVYIKGITNNWWHDLRVCKGCFLISKTNSVLRGKGALENGGRGRKLEIGLSLCCLAPLKVQWMSNLKRTESKDIVRIYYQQWRRAGTSYLFITLIVSHLILSVVGKMYVIFMSCAKGGVFGGDYFKRRFDAVIFLVMTAEWYM